MPDERDPRDPNGEFDHPWKPHFERCYQQKPHIKDPEGFSRRETNSTFEDPSEDLREFSQEESERDRIMRMVLSLTVIIVIGTLIRKHGRFLYALLANVIVTLLLGGILWFGISQSTEKPPPDSVDASVLL